MAPAQAPVLLQQQLQTSFNSLYHWFPTILYGFLGALSMYVMAWNNMDEISDRFSSTYGPQRDSFDFIIVGSGSAGSVVANRLSRFYDVLLLEAGGEPNPFSSVPGLSFLMLSHPELDWLHKTVPQKAACKALPNRQAGWSAGRGLGGTSNANFLIYLRGHPRDFNQWANITGDASWSYEGVLPHFKSIESYSGEFDNDVYHGHSGEMNIQVPDYLGMADTFIKAGQELGYPRTDLNGPFTQGFSNIFYPIKNGRRHGGYSAFIDPVRGRQRLTIYKFSTVTKVLLNDRNKAYGVEYIRHGIKKEAYASKEVVVSGGAIMSPKILMHSGIGPRKHLEELGIPVKSNLPVGQNLQDHISTYLGPFFVDQPMSMLLDRDLDANALYRFTREGTGPMSTSGCQATGFVSSTAAAAAGQSDWPDLQFILLGTGVYKRMAPDFARAFHVDPDVMTKYMAHAVGKDSFQIIVSVARPKARGEIRLKSRDFRDALHIDPKYLENDHDVRVFVEGVKRAVHLVENTTTFNQVQGRFTDVPFPGCEGVQFRSDAYWECFVRHYSITLHHIVGSCSMGRRDSKEAVVDPELRVIGVDGLRVVDASVMPTVVVSNTNAASVMIGEKGAQMILNRWRQQRTSANSQFSGGLNEIIR